MFTTITTQTENGICTLTINRPDKLNALNGQVISELGSFFNEVNNNEDIKCIVLTGSGAKAFVAGADISEFANLNAEQGAALAKKGQDVFFAIENCTKPVIAAVNGFALGGGCELAMACHFRIASENAKFGQPEVNLGLIPGYGGTQRLTQLIGKGRAMQLILTGHVIDANEAKTIGLVNQVTTAEDLLKHCYNIAEIMISKAPLALAKSIAAINLSHTGQAGYQAEASLFGECIITNDAKEGTLAFMEKRKAVFTGK
jgi:enoyl-CoA hydratase